MAYELPAGTATVGGRSRRFWLHLGDNLFRHLLLFIAPIVLLTAVGVLVSQRSDAEYRSTATLDASANPLVASLNNSANNFNFQTPAQYTASLFNEQLRTNVFAENIAASTGIDVNVVGVAGIRGNVSAGPNGTNLVDVSATWADPETARLLAEAAVDTLREYVVEFETQQSREAEDFYTDLLAQAEDEALDAQEALIEFETNLPALGDDEDLAPEERIRLTGLQQEFEQATEQVQAAEAQIQQAQLQIAQLTSNAGQAFRVIDAPEAPLEPESRFVEIVGVILAFFALGVLVAIAALLVTTAFDRTVRFDLDIAAVAASPIVASVSPIKSLRRAPTAVRGVLQPPGEDPDPAADDELDDDTDLDDTDLDDTDLDDDEFGDTDGQSDTAETQLDDDGTADHTDDDDTGDRRANQSGWSMRSDRTTDDDELADSRRR